MAMEKLSVKAATVSGAVASGVLHALFGLAYLGAPGMMRDTYSMMMYNSVQYGIGAFSATSWIGNIIAGAIFGAVLGYLVAVSYNWAAKPKIQGPEPRLLSGRTQGVKV